MIELKNVTKTFTKNSQSVHALDGISFNVAQGECVVLKGRSGSGKSTLVDIIIGLYRPKRGTVYIDDQELNEQNIRDWRKKIGYIPQMIALKDGSVAENVTFLDDIDEEKVKIALKKANIKIEVK